MATSPSDVHQCATCASVLYNRIPVLVALMLHVGGDVCDGYITSDVHQCATCASVLYNRIPVLVALILHVKGDVCDGYITQ